MRQKFVSFFVSLLVIFGTYFVYQNWLENDSNLQYSDSIAYSHATDVITLSAPTGKRLVPVGAVLGRNDVNSVEYVFSIAVEEGQTLEVLLENVTIKNNKETYTDVQDILLYEYEVEMKSALEAVVCVTISLRMPSNEMERFMIQGGRVSFQILFNPKTAI